MILPRDQVNVIIKNGETKGIPKEAIIDSLIKKGYEPEGLDIAKWNSAKAQQVAPVEEKLSFKDKAKEALGDIKQVGKDVFDTSIKRGENIQDIEERRLAGEVSDPRAALQKAGQYAGAGAEAIGSLAKGLVNVFISDKDEKDVTDALSFVANEGMEAAMKVPIVKSVVKDAQKWYAGLDENQKADVDAAGGALALASEFIGVGGAKKVATELVDAGVDAVKRARLATAEKLAMEVKPLTVPKATSGAKALGDVIEDVRPKAADLRDRTLAKALRLAPIEDIATIKQSTGNDIGEFMNRFDLVKDTPGETVDAISKFQRQNFDRTRDAIALIDDKFTFQDIPQMKDSIDFLIKDLRGRKSPEYQQALQKLSEIKQKGEFELLDAQYVKNLFDDVESVYKRTGDVRDAVAAQDKAQTIAPVRRFIEDRVQEVYPQIDIRALNNNVQTSRAILDATLKRAAKGDTSSFFQLGDLAILGVGNAQTAGLGYGALFAKKVFESSPIQLRLSRFFSGKVKAGDVVKGLTPEKLKEIDEVLTKELKNSMLEPEIKTKLNEVKDEIYKVKAKTTTTKTIPKSISIPKTIPKGKKPSSDSIEKIMSSEDIENGLTPAQADVIRSNKK